MAEIGMHPGATWRKADFQIHTPRDPQWQGSPNLAGGSDELEAARKAWAAQFVAECVQRGLTAIAITDHHDFCFVSYVQEAIAALPDDERRLWLFPGSEVTCNDAVQCLVLFDADTTEDIWHRLFGGHLQGVTITNRNLAACPQAQPCGKEVKDFILGLSQDTAVNSRSIALPHASNDGAHKSMLRQGFNARFRDLPFDGIYTDKAFSALDDVPKQKIHGKIPEWGERRRGIIPTGDNRRASFERLGAHDCWVRLGEPTAEAIRQAVLADEARIAYSAPALPPQRIELLEIDSSLTGPDFKLWLNDGFTALIGGRGSGKTAVLEYLRYGIGRSATDISPDSQEERAREYGLITNTLGPKGVRVTLIRDGVREVWSRTLERSDAITVTLPDGGTERLSIPDAQQRFRARGFYQKQLSTLVSDRQKASEQITGIAAAEYIDRRQQADQRLAAAKREVQACFQRMVEFWITQAENERDRVTVADLKRRIEAIQKQLHESGLSPEAQAVLNAAPLYNFISSLGDEAKEAIEKDKKALADLTAAIPTLDIDQLSKGSQFDEVTAFIGAIENEKAVIHKAFGDAKASLDAMSAAHSAFEQAFGSRKQAFDVEHNAALVQQQSFSTLLAELQKLTSALQNAEAAERKSAQRFKSMEGVPEALVASRSALNGVLADRHALLAEVAARVQLMSDGVLEAEVGLEDEPQQFVEALVQVCDSSRLREAQSRCEDAAKRALGDGAEAWSAITDAVAHIYRHKVQTQAVNVDGVESIKQKLEMIFGSLTQQQIATMYSRLEALHPSAMMVATPDAFVTFRYKDAKGIIPFEQASPGQQAAALLHLLLYQQAGTLIIDQPEDDLDNKTVMKIVRLLQTTKQNRQLIFATHNPNFVVNGDADKVVALIPAVDADRDEDGARIGIEVDGAIETPNVRTSITETMEGGKAAFELRSRKYQFSR